MTIRLGNHNATVSNFDFRDEDNGISIVVSKRANKVSRMMEEPIS